MTKARWATPDDISIFYGGKVGATVQAVVLDVNGVLLGVAGIYSSSGKIICFSDFKPEASAYKKSIIQGATMLLDLMRKKRRPIYAVRDDAVPTSKRFLTYLGFEDEGDFYVWQP